MEEKEGFVEDSKVALKGVVNGILGSYIYNYIIVMLLSIIVSTIVANNNPGATSDELLKLANKVFSDYPFSLIASCLGSIATLVVSIVIIKWSKFKELCKKAFNKKTLKYGLLGFICIVAFQYFYGILSTLVFGLDSSGNSNQEGVVGLIQSSPIFGFLLVVVLAPLVEELTYRYFLFGGTSKKKKWVGYLVSGIVFMLMHSISSFSDYGFSKELVKDLLYLPSYLFSGIILCLVYDKSSNLGSSFIAHVLNNLLAFLGAVLLVIGL